MYLHYLSKPVEAQAEFQRAIDLDPSYGEALTNLGVTLAQQGRWESAVAAYRQAISLPTYPSPEVAYANLGWAYLNLNKPREAEESYRAAVQLQPRFSQAYYFLGVVRTNKGEKTRRKRPFAPPGSRSRLPVGQKAGDLLKAMGEGGSRRRPEWNALVRPVFPLTPSGFRVKTVQRFGVPAPPLSRGACE